MSDIKTLERRVSMNPLTSNFLSGSFSTSTSKNYRKTTEKKNTKKAFVIHRSMNETGYLMRLAQAKTPSQVAAVVSLARADARSVKQSSDSSAEIANAKKIAKSIEKQGNVKSAKLRKENQLKKKKIFYLFLKIL